MEIERVEVRFKGGTVAGIRGRVAFRSGGYADRRGNLRYPYKRYCTERVDGLRLICRAADVPEPDTEVHFWAHKNPKGTVWCCHIEPEDLPEGGNLAGRYFHEVIREEFDPSENGSMAFARDCQFNGGPVLRVQPGVTPRDQKLWYRPGFHLVWIAAPTQMTDDQIVILEEHGQTEEENPLAIKIEGQWRGVFQILGFIDFDEQSPPAPQEVRRVYARMVDATRDKSEPVLAELVKRGEIGEREAKQLQANAAVRRYVLASAYHKAYRHAVEVHGPEKAEESPAVKTVTLVDLVERAAKSVPRRQHKTKTRKVRKAERPANPADAITIEDIVASTPDTHFKKTSRADVVRILKAREIATAADYLAADKNELKSSKVLGSQPLVNAIESTAKKLAEAKPPQPNPETSPEQ